jgi:hypothetical protein
MSEALAQLRAGVPLNWSQVEDDDALATLSFLQPAAIEAFTLAGLSNRADLRETIVADLRKRLPEPKPQPVMEKPKTMAGFSERVQVLTQVDEDVPPLVTNVPQWIGACVAAAAAVAFFFWLIAGSAPASAGPAYAWIEIHNGPVQVSRIAGRDSWADVPCRGVDAEDPGARREFTSVPDPEQLQDVAGFTVLHPRREISVPGGEMTHTLRFIARGFSPCSAPVPDPLDPGRIVRMEYLAYSRTAAGRLPNLARIKVFEAERFPMKIDVSTGEWEEVTVGTYRGVYWHGDGYRDLEGQPWREGAHVLIIEDDVRITAIVTEANEGYNRDVLLNIASGLSSTRPPELWRRTDVAGALQVDFLAQR